MTADVVDVFFQEKRESYYDCDSELPLNRIADLFFFRLGFASNLQRSGYGENNYGLFSTFV